MKRNRLQRLASLALSMFVALSMMAAATGGAYAASSWDVSVGSGNGGVIWQGETTGAWVYNTKTGKDAKIISVKSSNSKVKVKKNSYGGDTWFNIQGKKTGKARLAIKFKSGGKTKTIKKNVIVKNILII